MLTLVDYFGGNFTIYVLATLEVIGVAWVYGLQNICDDIQFMLNIKVGIFWRFTWGFFVPIVLVLILVYSLAISEPLKHSGNEFPHIATGQEIKLQIITTTYFTCNINSFLVCGWLLSAVCLACVPIFAVRSIQKINEGTLVEVINFIF